ncbi:hypothetical protein U27_06258 [Candidatus Vecturithrix granuli]|uniref:Leucine rich repeat variant n=1 Tax=Vecturithrix granuli TaxID=1499967 RepID=A0A081C3X6_VECG1|nr:hypothetical protein U27_06258 [Candidatus Vecturithrix granuli]
MSECTCRGANPNCYKCGGKGYLDDSEENEFHIKSMALRTIPESSYNDVDNPTFLEQKPHREYRKLADSIDKDGSSISSEYTHLIKHRNRKMARSTDKDVLTFLSKDNDDTVRCLVAKNPDTPSQILEELAKDPVPSVRLGVAENYTSPLNVLAILAKDIESGIRRRVAQHHMVSLSIIELLSMDIDKEVRIGIAQNPKTPFHVLSVLSKDFEREVRDLSINNLIEHFSLSDLKLYGNSIELICKECGHNGRIEIAKLITSFGENVLLNNVKTKFYCSRCKSYSFIIKI